MAEAHIGSILPIKNRVLGVDEHCAALFHYDLNEHDVLRGVKALGQKEVLNFDGASTYVECGNICNMGLDDMTIEVWVKTAQSTSTNTYLVSKSFAGASPYRYGMSIKSGNLGAFMQGNGGADVSLRGAATISNGEWHHVALVFHREGDLELYVDGQLDGAGSIAQWNNADMQSDFPFRIGSYTSGDKVSTSSHYEGIMHGLQVFRRAKTPEELRQSMNGVVTERGVLGKWRMDEGEGNLLKDSSAFHNDAVIMGDAEWVAGNSVFTLRPQEGKFGGAIAVEEATTNLDPDPLGFTGYSIGGGGWVTQSVVDFQGKRCWKLDVDCPPNQTAWAGAYIGINLSNFGVADDWFTRTCMMYVEPGGTYSGTRPEINATHGGLKNGSNSSYDRTKLGTWQTLSVSAQIADVSGNTNIYFYLFSKSANSTEHIKYTVYIAQPQLEKKRFSTSFVNGRRNEPKLAYDAEGLGVIPTKDWTISGWFKRNKDVTGWSALFTVGKYYQEGESELQVWSNHNGQLKFWSHDNKSGRSFTIISDPNPGELEEWFFFALTHEAATSEYKGYVWTKDRYAKESRIVPHTNPIFPELGIGGWSQGGNTHAFNGLIDELRIDKVVRTEEELTAWYESNSPFWPRGIYRKSH